MTPKKDRGPAFYLFHSVFQCAVPAIHTYSDEWLSEVGVYTSGDRQIDQGSMQDLVYLHLTIAGRDGQKGMVDYHRENVNVILAQPSDSVRIYELIRDHLAIWAEKLATSVNLPPPPLEELEAMDAFASSIYKVARRYGAKGETTASLVARLRNMGQGRGIRRAADIQPLERPKPKEHNPLIDGLREGIELRNRGKSWP